MKKLAIVIGGSEGIGLAVASELASSGADVIIGSRYADKLDHAIRALEKLRKNVDQVLATVVMDVTDGEATRAQLESVMKQYRTPDLLINSAGFAHPGYLENLDVSVLRQMMDVNYFGAVHTIKAVLPAMRKAGQGHIVNVSSVAGYLGLFGYTGYCASKYAVIGFSWALRNEVKPYGISVSVLCPANTRTPGFDRENRLKPAEVLAMEEKLKTVSAERVARALMRSLASRSFLIHPTFDARLVYLASRLAPTQIMDMFLRRPRPVL